MGGDLLVPEPGRPRPTLAPRRFDDRPAITALGASRQQPWRVVVSSRGARALRVHPARFAVWRLSPDDTESWLASAEAPKVEGGFFSVTRTSAETSIVSIESAVPAGVPAERGMRALEVEGPLDFSLTGILAGLSATLAEAEVPIFAISTYDTDYLLIRDELLDLAIKALGAAGYRVRDR